MPRSHYGDIHDQGKYSFTLDCIQMQLFITILCLDCDYHCGCSKWNTMKNIWPAVDGNMTVPEMWIRYYYSHNSMTTYHCIRRGCKTLHHQVAAVTDVCMVAPNICGYSVWESFWGGSQLLENLCTTGMSHHHMPTAGI